MEERRRITRDKDGELMEYVPWARPPVRITVSGVAEIATKLGIDIDRGQANAIAAGIRPPSFNRSEFERITAAISKTQENENVHT